MPFAVFGQEVSFELGSDDPWNQERSRLNHTDFGNGVLRYWTDTGRWASITRYVSGTGDNWNSESRRVWEDALQKWHNVKQAMIDHAKRVFADYRPLADGEESIRASAPHAPFCSKAARRWLQVDGRFDSWLVEVQQAISHVDRDAYAIQELVRRRAETSTGILAPESELREYLSSLAKSGRRLKEVFSGRGYFNHGQSD